MKENLILIITSPLWITALLLLIIADTLIFPIQYISRSYYDSNVEYYGAVKRFML